MAGSCFRRPSSRPRCASSATSSTWSGSTARTTWSASRKCPSTAVRPASTSARSTSCASPRPSGPGASGSSDPMRSRRHSGQRSRCRGRCSSAFPAMVLFAEWRYLRSGDPLFRTLAKRWSKTMIALFAVGVVTGTILSFEFGLLWPGFMAAFGGVFGLGFALEGFSFFVEAIFIAIYVYGWERLPPRLHFLSGIPVVIAGVTGSLFVISVNGWMNHPSGFALENGTAVDAQPWSALFGNSYFWHELVHMYVAGYIVAGFLVATPYAWGALRGRVSRYERTALAIALSAAAIASMVQPLIGDWAAREVAKQQPVKLAAMEGLARTTAGAPEHLLGWYDGDKVVYGIEIPRLLSLFAFHDPNATVQGLETVPPTDRPPVNVVRLSFQTMVGIGTLLAFLGLVFLYVRFRKGRLPESRWFYRAVVLAGPLSVVALIAGWLTT